MTRICFFLMIALFAAESRGQGYGLLRDWELGIEVQLDKILGLENSGLLIGTEYKLPPKGYSTHPFLGTQGGGSAIMQLRNGSKYTQVPLVIDLFQNQMAIRYLRSDGRISLVRIRESEIKSLRIFGRDFVKLSHGAKENWFEVLFQKDSSLLVFNRKKVIQAESSSKVEYIEENDVYWVQGDVWFNLNRTSDFFNLARHYNKEQEFKLFLKERGLNVRKRSEDDIKSIALFYSTAR